MAHHRRYPRRRTPDPKMYAPCCCDCGAGDPASFTVSIEGVPVWTGAGSLAFSPEGGGKWSFEMDPPAPVERELVIDHDAGIAYASERHVYPCGYVDNHGIDAAMVLPTPIRDR